MTTTTAGLDVRQGRPPLLGRRGPPLLSSDYAIWTPKWLVEAFVDFQIPEDMTEYAPLTVEAKKKILGLNAAKMYGIEVPAELRLPEEDAAPATGPRDPAAADVADSPLATV